MSHVAMEVDDRPGRGTAESLATAAVAAIAAVTLACAALVWGNRSVLYGNDYFLFALFTATTIAYTVSGRAVARRAGNPVGWLALATAFVLEAGIAFLQYGIFALETHPGSLPGAAILIALAEGTPVLTLTGIVSIVHVFPTGRPAGRRWTPFVVLTVAGGWAAVLGTLVTRHRIVDVWSDELSHAGVAVHNPFGFVGPTGIDDAFDLVVALAIGIGAIGAIASIVVRRRRAGVDERAQLRWLTTVAGAAGIWIVAWIPLFAVIDPNGAGGSVFWLVATPLVALGPPIAIGIGIVKYRLFDIDVVIRKTVIVTVVVVALLAVYLAVLALATVSNVSRVVVGLALLLVTFNPVRRAATSIADRVAYGRRASSYEVLAGFSRRMADAYANEDVLDRMASILRNGTSARSATVWLRVGDELRPEAAAGEVSTISAPARIPGDALPALPGYAVEVRHEGQLLGALSVEMPSNDPLDNARRDLIADMASQAGLVLRNVRLIEELRDSRQRLVAAQDRERRRIERNIHDGAQQQLVALAVKLRLVDSMVGRDEAKAHELLSRLQAEAQETLDDLRDLARGIYPPLLADKGLVTALEAQARKSPLPVSVATDGEIGRAHQDVEAAAYFCVLEAMQNAAKYANASHVVVRLGRRNGSLLFSVSDDGAGFDPAATPRGSGLTNIRDRLEALGGTVDVRSRPGEGTHVDGRIPAGAGATP
jgi:signal transduction histidine kinase